MGRVTDHERIGLSQSLYPGGKVGGFSESQLLLSPTISHGTDNDQTRMDTHTDSELDTLPPLQTGIEVSHRLQEIQASAYGSVCIILMGLWIAKIHEESIT